MKLTELAIEGNTHAHINIRDVRLGQFSSGLNFIYGENGAGKSALRQFVRSLLNPGLVHPPAAPSDLISERWNGSVGIASPQGKFRFVRDDASPQNVRLEALAPANGFAGTSDLSHASTGLNPTLDHRLVDSIYNFSFRDSLNDRFTLATALNEQLHVPVGPDAASDQGNVPLRQRQIDELRAELNRLQTAIELRKRERADLNQSIDTTQLQCQDQLAEINLHIGRIATRLSEFSITNLRAQSGSIESQIAAIRQQLEEASRPISVPVAPVTTTPDIVLLYQRLDDLDGQIQRWRHVQTDIQKQRVRLKDEMLVWNEMTLDSDDHPYHNAREILVGLEARVDQTEQTARRWSGTIASQVDVAQMTQALEDICKQMRDDLYGLCHELSHQYKHIRQKAAAVELKQLRRCYNEMGENTQRLVKRRDSLIHEIRVLDPAGADAIVRSDHQFCQCANHEGYLAARRRYVGEITQPTVTAPVYTTVQPDLTHLQQQLPNLESQRNDLLAAITHSDSDRIELERQHADWIAQRDRLTLSADVASWTERIRQIDLDVERLELEYNLVLAKLEAVERETVAAPNPILIHAGRLLNQVTNGELTQVFLIRNDYRVEATAAAGTRQLDLQIRDRLGKVHNFTGVDHACQNQVYLCLALAACDTLAANGTRQPILIDDAFVHIGPDRVNQTLATLDDFCKRNDQQIFLLTQHRYLADRLPGLAVLELAPTAPVSSPVHVPHRVPSQPIATPLARPAIQPTVQPDPQNLFASGVVINDVPGTLAGSWPQAVSADADRFRPYPLSKYAPEAGAVLVSAERDEEYQMPWSPLNRSAETRSIEIKQPHTRSDETRVVATEVALTESMDLEHLRLFDAARLNLLAEAGLTTIDQLLSLDASRLPAALHEAGITDRQIDRWQSQTWLLLTIPALGAFDARVLVACGINEPEHLDTSHARQLLERVERFLNSADGQRYRRDRADRARLTLDDIDRWHRSLDSTRSRWQGGRRNRRSRSQSGSYSNRSSSSGGHLQRGERDSNRGSRTSYRSDHNDRDSKDRDHDRNERNRSRTYSVSDYPQRQRMTAGDRPDRVRTEREDRNRDQRTPASALAPRSTSSGSTSGGSSNSNGSSSQKSKRGTSESRKALKFYLDLSDHIEAAPSIGPKTAERFEKIGVNTIADFLKQTAESVAERLNYKRITVDLVRLWQHQARLVCRIPNLRGHDAQLLVACGYTEPEDISAMQPQKLFGIVGPFSETKEGLKIIRSGKKPDLAEVTDWIGWSEHMRSLQAA